MRELTEEENAKLEEMSEEYQDSIKPKIEFKNDDEYQHKILSAFIQDQDFANRNINLVDSRYFRTVYLASIAKVAKKYLLEYKTLPTRFVLNAELEKEIAEQEPEIQLMTMATLHKLFEYDSDALKVLHYLDNELRKWMEDAATRLAIHEFGESDIKDRNKLQAALNEIGTMVTDSSKERSFTTAEFMLRPKAEFLIKKHILAGSMNLIYGPSGVGKSFFAIEMAISIALGRVFLGKYPTKQRKVAYLVSEAEGAFPVRLQAWQKHHGIDLSEVINLRWIPEGFDFQDPDCAIKIAACLPPDFVPDIVFIDTVACNIGGDENNPDSMNKFIKSCHAIKAHFAGCGLAGVHHEGKDSTRGARGHSSLTAACQSIIHIEGKPDGVDIVIKCDKLTTGKPFKGYILDKVVVTVDEADDDNPDSLILQWATESETAFDSDKYLIGLVETALLGKSLNKQVLVKEVRSLWKNDDCPGVNTLRDQIEKLVGTVLVCDKSENNAKVYKLISG